MRRLRYLTALGACVVLACGDSAREEASPRQVEAGSKRAAPEGPAAAPRGGGSAGTTRIHISGTVGGRTVDLTGMGECEHSADGSIYQRPASLWTARYEGGNGDPLQHLNLTFWRERAGSESVSLAVSNGEATHRIATVEGGERHGRGTATLEAGSGLGTFVVEGTSDDGGGVRLRIRCERFTTLVAEGG
jgi:hypothetical protein